ncbi:Uncharacterised protein [Metamycoplasma arthritidis]|uniref:hypothetical protein n=1 Tax=Metamycoplasma arthritidis TaxID=2111 RepID=UPI0010051FEB|nr:hypothetical protein [Metamycoplasma arthritidis]VEU78933.1 Uncharacterised protein [Metamycoplasma arthritidis]
MNRKLTKILLVFLPIIIVFIVFISFLTIKLSGGYRPSIYNYESYLAPEIKNKLKQNYNYKEFKEVNEFTQALNAEKAIAGVGSDFQAAQLIIDNKIRKIDFTKIFNENANSWEYRKKLFRPAIVKHMEAFDRYIYDAIANKKHPKARILDQEKKTYDVDGDGKADHFYDYIIPYYSQDKGIAYNTNKSTRPHLDTEAATKELANQNGKLNWLEIVEILKKYNYKRFGWTNAYYDNLMLGAINKNVSNYNQITEENYKEYIDSFVDFVKKATGANIKDTDLNFMSNDGLELLNHLIEPKAKRSDAAVLYNGDALDAYYSRDNFDSVQDGNVRFIRPKNNYILMDVWIISQGLSDKDTNTLLQTLKENVYANNNVNSTLQSSLKTIEDKFFEEFKKHLTEDVVEFEKARLKSSYANDTNLDNILKEVDEFRKALIDNNYEKILELRNSKYKYFHKFFQDVFDQSEVPEIANFNYISYTPTDSLFYEFIKKWYFANDKIALEIYSQFNDGEIAGYKLLPYPIIDTNLRTKIVAYYYEKTRS